MVKLRPATRMGRSPDVFIEILIDAVGFLTYATDFFRKQTRIGKSGFSEKIHPSDDAKSRRSARPHPTADAKSSVRRLKYVVCGGRRSGVLLLTWKVPTNRNATRFDRP